jgi:hypothetical protein
MGLVSEPIFLSDLTIRTGIAESEVDKSEVDTCSVESGSQSE